MEAAEGYRVLGVKVMEAVIERLFEYGVLGLWTVTLFWSNRAMAARSKEEREEMYDMRERMQSDIIGKLEDVETKVDEGLRAMREKYQEERLQQMIRTKGFRTQVEVSALDPDDPKNK